MSLSKTFYPLLTTVQPMKTGKRPEMTVIKVDCDVLHQYEQTKSTKINKRPSKLCCSYVRLPVCRFIFSMLLTI